MSRSFLIDNVWPLGSPSPQDTVSIVLYGSSPEPGGVYATAPLHAESGWRSNDRIVIASSGPCVKQSDSHSSASNKAV
jgi:hypothetical protein